MIRLTALTVAEEVPLRFGGRVHSVFRRAFNLELGGGELVPVVPGRHQPVGGIGLDPNFPAGFTVQLKPGQPCARQGHLIQAGDSLAIDLDRASRWSPPSPAFQWERDPPAIERAWRAASARFLVQPPHLASAALRLALGRMVHARSDEERANAARALVGLGPGLTPSGDDALVGWLCAVHALMRGGGFPPDAVRLLAATIRDSLLRTGDISRHYLRHAAKGRVGPHLSALLSAVQSGNAAATAVAVDEALALGATSGADGVLGLLTGLASGHPEPESLVPRDPLVAPAAA